MVFQQLPVNNITIYAKDFLILYHEVPPPPHTGCQWLVPLGTCLIQSMDSPALL